jgi:hypothetical protein
MLVGLPPNKALQLTIHSVHRTTPWYRLAAN